MTRRLNLYMQDELADELEKIKPKFLSLSAFCTCLLAETLDRGARISAYHVGAGKELESKELFSKKLSSEQLFKEEINHPSSNQKSLIPLNNLGDSVGKEHEETPRKGPFTKIPKNLRPFEDKILDFWKIKKGTKNNHAWNLQMTELTKILDDLGEDVLIDQLDNACLAGTWKQINYRRTVQFMEVENNNKKKKAPEPEPKHPAYEVFRAEEHEPPTVNPMLQDLMS